MGAAEGCGKTNSLYSDCSNTTTIEKEPGGVTVPRPSKPETAPLPMRKLFLHRPASFEKCGTRSILGDKTFLRSSLPNLNSDALGVKNKRATSPPNSSDWLVCNNLEEAEELWTNP
jgi:hypothetical protein